MTMVFFVLNFVCCHLGYADHKLQVDNEQFSLIDDSSNGAIIAIHSFKDLGKGQYQVSLSLQKNNQYNGSIKLGGKREFRLKLTEGVNEYPLDIANIIDSSECLDSILSGECRIIIVATTGSISGNPPEYKAYFLHVPLHDDKGGGTLLDIIGVKPELEALQEGRLSPNSNSDYTLDIKNISKKPLAINISLESGCINLNNPIREKNLYSGSIQAVSFKIHTDVSAKLGCAGYVVVDHKVDSSSEIKRSWIPIKIHLEEEIGGTKIEIYSVIAEVLTLGAVAAVGGWYYYYHYYLPSYIAHELLILEIAQMRALIPYQGNIFHPEMG